jgi:transcription termination/antitermination protein NusG
MRKSFKGYKETNRRRVQNHSQSIWPWYCTYRIHWIYCNNDKTTIDKIKMAETQTEQKTSAIYALRTTANREEQVMDFLTSNINKKKLQVYSVILPHGMRGYIFLESASRSDAEQAAFGIPYARGILPSEVNIKELEHMFEQAPSEMNMQKNDIAEIISGSLKREQCKIQRVDPIKGEVVVVLLDAAVPIPITLKMDAVKVIRREGEEAK